jgi:hypothetical protein
MATDSTALGNRLCAVRGCDHATTSARITASGIVVGYCNTHAFEAHVLFGATPALKAA